MSSNLFKLFELIIRLSNICIMLLIFDKSKLSKILLKVNIILSFIIIYKKFLFMFDAIFINIANIFS